MSVIQIRNVLTESECEVYMEWIDYKMTHARNLQTFKHEKLLDEYCAEHLLNKVNDKYDGDNIDYISACVVIAKYETGEQSSLHKDPSYDDKTDYRLLIYLNNNFDGGETKFYSNNFKLQETVVPEIGKAILFRLDRYHQGTKILSDGNKYFIGGQVSLDKIKKKLINQ